MLEKSSKNSCLRSVPIRRMRNKELSAVSLGMDLRKSQMIDRPLIKVRVHLMLTFSKSVRSPMQNLLHGMMIDVSITNISVTVNRYLVVSGTRLFINRYKTYNNIVEGRVLL